MVKLYPLLAAAALAAFIPTLPSRADDWPQWRGPLRNGHSSETGLMNEWPKAGPKLLWKIDNAGMGYATPAVVGARLYLLGNEGVENEFVRALAVADGKPVWTARLGKVGNPEQQPKFPAARSTPTVDGELLYALGSDGDLACVELASGRIRWQKNLRTEFGGKPGVWAYSESPLVDGDFVMVTPGGTQATLVALNKRTGDVQWKCAAPAGDEAAYASAIIVEIGGVRQYVQLLQKGLVGVDAKNGKLLWRYDKAVSRYGANIPTPLASDGLIYTAAAGTGGGAIRVNYNDGRFQPESVYFESKYPTAIGGAVKVGDALFGTTGQALLCIQFSTGKQLWEERSLGAASLCEAEGRLYLHGENGEVALVVAAPGAYMERGHFAPPDQPKRLNDMEKAWTYPIIANGRLFLRDHNLLWCYDIQQH
jgi:outer membrane protein assembly factor BamB